MDRQRAIGFTHWSSASIFFVSIAIIALQLTLIRSMSVLRYYHFSYLVISTALLGFGASGTFLTFAYDRMKQQAAEWISGSFLLLMISIPVCYITATSLPLDVRFVFYSTEQLSYLLLYNLLMFIPFFIGAVIIGFMLTYFKDRVPTLYGFNLIGSGLGALLAIGLMFIMPSARLPLIVGVLPWFAFICWLMETKDQYRTMAFPIIGLIVASILGTVSLMLQPNASVDPYKAYSHFKDLEQQGDAEHVLSDFGPRAQIDVFDSKTIHHTLFAGIEADTVPPPQMAVLLDGQMAGYMFKAVDTSETRILEFVPQSLPYRLIDTPKVLLLGEISGVNIWLAKRFGARDITAVQTNPQLLNVLADSLKRANGQIFHHDEIQTVSRHPRLFLEQTEEQFDIIQFVGAEGMPSSGGGLQGLHEDYLLTVDALQTAIDHLSPTGALALTRGMQSPPRDNIKIFSMMAESLKDADVDRPERHLFQSRNYLAVQNMLWKSAATDSLVERYRRRCDRLGMDIEYAGGAAVDTTNIRNVISGAGAKHKSWYGEAATAILSDQKETLFDGWIYNVRPPTDNQPYFHDFFKWSSLPRFIEQYGTYWFRKVELGYAILALTLTELVIVGFVLILLPLILLRSDFRKSGHTAAVFFYFAALGIGYLFLEMVYIQQFTKFMGDPIYSVSAALTAILVSSGLGSSLQSKLPGSSKSRIRLAGAFIVGIASLYLLELDALLQLFIDQTTAVRFLITLLLLFPISFFMGWMFPNGMQLIGEDERDRLVPWAWGVNGFLSVAASPLAVMLSISVGFNGTVLAAVGCYALAVGTTYIWSDQ